MGGGCGAARVVLMWRPCSTSSLPATDDSVAGSHAAAGVTGEYAAASVLLLVRGRPRAERQGRSGAVAGQEGDMAAGCGVA